MAKPLPKDDLAHVLQHAREDLEQLRGARLFVTGGTGFFGKWLVETFLHANRELRLGAAMTVLTRDAVRFEADCPHLASDPSLSFHPGDVRTFEFPAARFTHIIHGAVASSNEPLESFVTSVEGTRRVLDLATRSDAKRLLFLSSGAVYGPQPPGMTHVPETYLGAPDTLQTSSGYGEAKRAAEYLCCASSPDHKLESVIARCFAFVGPHLPLNANFAIGNFMADVLAGRPISVLGDGTTYRSYLHAADLSIWLWALLVRGANGRAYNVGSDEGITIAALAKLVAEAAGGKSEVRIARTPVPGVAPPRYVPSIERARAELGLGVRIKLREGIQRTIAWLRQ
ncbi:MAG TPA: NAD-dependent epimerase/dehydratase family protein [Verrucomicrobiae bacterium]|jgi:nucleoside-diphosphate-sugar epimerase|nr:NAD-dependent epimerase/dehydratase family protein [Verrucomicrobiae bacterium]